MTLQSHPTHPVGSQAVKVLIKADTVCAPHGLVEAGQVVVVSVDEFWQLKYAGKAELAPEVAAAPKVDDEQLVTVDELRAKLVGLTKAELIAGAKENHGLELSESLKKDELIAAIVEAATKAEE